MENNTTKVIDVVLRKNFPEILRAKLEFERIFSEGKISYVGVDITIDKKGFEKRFMSDNKYTDDFGKLTYIEFEDIYDADSNRISNHSTGGVKKYFNDIDKMIIDSVKLSGREVSQESYFYWNIQNVYFV
jgi:hypothetical protein